MGDGFSVKYSIVETENRSETRTRVLKMNNSRRLCTKLPFKGWRTVEAEKNKTTIESNRMKTKRKIPP